MKATVLIPPDIQSVIAELPARERQEFIQKLEYLERFPRMYQMREKGRFRRHRRFLTGGWMVYYRVFGNTVFIRGVWPARMR